MAKHNPFWDENNNPVEEEKPHLTFSSFEKRVAAWVALVCVVMIVLATTYMMATAKPLAGTAYLFLPPAAVGVAIIAIYRQKKGVVREGRNYTAALLFLCFIVFVVGLVCGIPNLLANFGIYIDGFTAPVT